MNEMMTEINLISTQLQKFLTLLLIVILSSKLLKRSKAKRSAPAYSRVKSEWLSRE